MHALLFLYLAVVATATHPSSQSGSLADTNTWISLTSSPSQSSRSSETAGLEPITSYLNHFLPEQCSRCTIRPQNLLALHIEVVTTHTTEITTATSGGNGW